MMRTLVFLTLMVLAGARAHATSYYFWLAYHHDWDAKKGCFLDLEGQVSGDLPVPLSSVKLILGVADGTRWRLINTQPAWEFDRDYHAKAIVGPQRSELWLDDKLIGRSDGSFTPDLRPLYVGYSPLWAHASAEYVVRQTSLKITSGSRRLTFDLADDALRPIGLYAFDPQTPNIADFRLYAKDTTVIEATFRFSRYPDAHGIAPVVDRYGQCKYADWSGTVKSDGDLVKADKDESARLARWGVSKDYDIFGGWKGAGWRERGTGYYRVARKSGYWWLISPEGNPCFYIGVGVAPGLAWEMTPVTGREFLFEDLPPKTGTYSACWCRGVWGDPDTEYVALHTANMIRKWGTDWERKGTALAVKRLRTFGFSGVGKWGEIEGMAYIGHLGVPGNQNIAGHPDVFDSDARRRLEDSLRHAIEPEKGNPCLVGWSMGNEYDQIITKDEVTQILAKPATVELKRSLIRYALKEIYGDDLAKLAQAWGVPAASLDDLYAATSPKPPSSDLDTMRRFYAERYYEFVYRTVKKLDPNHLFFGYWIVPGWWESEDDWRLMSPYCDVIGYDYYTLKFMDERLDRLVRESGKPIFWGEMSVPPIYGGSRGFGAYYIWARDDADAGRIYQDVMKSAASNPYCVGLCWFEYRDQYITGRGPGSGSRLTYGEDHAFGIVDVTDRPKWDLVERMRQINLQAARLRAQSSSVRVR